MAQLLFPIECTSEEYLNGQLWLKASRPACPFCKEPSGNDRKQACQLLRHGYYERVEPKGIRICRLRCPASGRTLSLLPEFLLSNRRGLVQAVEEIVAKAEQLRAEHRERTGKRLAQYRLAQLLRPAVQLPGALRWLRWRERAVQVFLSAVRGLYEERCPRSPGAGVCEFRSHWKTASVLPGLRRLAADELGRLPQPLGLAAFKKCGSSGPGRPPQRSGLASTARAP